MTNFSHPGLILVSILFLLLKNKFSLHFFFHLGFLVKKPYLPHFFFFFLHLAKSLLVGLFLDRRFLSQVIQWFN